MIYKHVCSTLQYIIFVEDEWSLPPPQNGWNFRLFSAAPSAKVHSPTGWSAARARNRNGAQRDPEADRNWPWRSTQKFLANPNKALLRGNPSIHDWSTNRPRQTLLTPQKLASSGFINHGCPLIRPSKLYFWGGCDPSCAKTNHPKYCRKFSLKSEGFVLIMSIDKIEHGASWKSGKKKGLDISNHHSKIPMDQNRSSRHQRWKGQRPHRGVAFASAWNPSTPSWTWASEDVYSKWWALQSVPTTHIHENTSLYKQCIYIYIYIVQHMMHM